MCDQTELTKLTGILQMKCTFEFTMLFEMSIQMYIGYVLVNHSYRQLLTSFKFNCIIHLFVFELFSLIPIDFACIVKRNRLNPDCSMVYVRMNRTYRHFINEFICFYQ